MGHFAVGVSEAKRQQMEEKKKGRKETEGIGRKHPLPK